MNSGENHLMHLHGFRFYVVRTGVGDFDNVTDPLTYNLVDPLEANTVPIPKDGWATMRFVASNPGTFVNLISYDKLGCQPSVCKEKD
ncbi:putative laccase-9 [Quercus suber]|uniref:Laccase-9 n=1 Tax=Quercus suber TaxID=58331 RepID=A0AAW0LQX2_QUESU